MADTETLSGARRYTAETTATVDVLVKNPDVIERVTGPGGDEWRNQFYGLRTAEDVIRHFAYNALRNDVTDVSRLEGWADVDPRDVEIVVSYDSPDIFEDIA